MYSPSFTGRFKQDRKRLRKRGWDVAHLDRVIAALVAGQTLSERYRVHALRGEFSRHWECHIEPDFLLVWYYALGDEIIFVRAGSHADLF